MYEYFFDEHLEHWYIIMETGPCFKDLWNFIGDKGKLDEEQSRKIFTQLLKTILALFDRNISHEDIKPENVLIDTSDEHNLPIRVIDFEHALVCSPKDMYKSRRKTGGTTDLLPPECVNAGKCASGPDTVWCLGLLLHDMLHGQVNTKAGKPPRINKKLSHNARSLLSDLLEVDPLYRANLSEDILRHPWFQE